MKKLILTVVLLLLVAGCSDQYNVSLWGDENLGIGIGNYIDPNKTTEISVTGTFRNDNEEPETIGVQAIRYGPVMEVANPFVIVGQDLPEKVSGRPFFGLAYDRFLDAKSTDFSQIVGVRIEEFFFVATRFNSEMESTALVGIKYDF